MDQINIVDITENTTSENQEITYQNIKKILLLHKRTQMNLIPKETSAYLSVGFQDKAIDFRIKFGKKTSYFALLNKFKSELEKNNIQFKSEKAPSNWLRINIVSPEDIFQYQDLICHIYDTRIAETTSNSFDCCSHYLECSNAKVCVHTEIQNLCKYDLKLKQGIIFYGKNRNI